MDKESPFEYFTIETPATGYFKDKGSKFYAFCYPFEDSDMLKEVIESLKKEHHNARHFCYAYRIKSNEIEERANDDGEPSHSAGTPILGQLQSNELENVLAVVVRYFGGTKLGIPGLINAYKSATIAAIEEANIVKKEVESLLKLNFDYAEMNNVMRIIKVLSPRIIKQTMNLRVEMVLSIRKDRLSELKNQLKNVKFLTFTEL